MAPREFHVKRSAVVGFRFLGVAGVVMGVLIVLGPLFESDVKWWLTVPVGTLLVIGAFWCLRFGFQPGRYSIELSDQGIRLPAAERWAPWTQLGGLSENHNFQRIDILDLRGARFASLDYQLMDFSEALDRVAAGVRLAAPEHDLFHRRVTVQPDLVLTVLGVVTIGFGVWLWLSERQPGGLLLPLMIIGVFILDVITEVWSVQLLAAGLTIRRGLRRQVIPWAEISKVEFVLRPFGNHGGQLLDVSILQESDSRKQIRPRGSNAFHLKARIAVWLERQKV